MADLLKGSLRRLTFGILRPFVSDDDIDSLYRFGSD